MQGSFFSQKKKKRFSGSPSNKRKPRLNRFSAIRTPKIATKKRGTTVHTYLDANGNVGGYQEMLKVYGHAGEPCAKCGTELEKIKVSGRGTTFCPHCQVVY